MKTYIDGNLIAKGYLNLLRDNIVPGTLNLFPDENRQEIPNRNIWFQKGGISLQYGGNVHCILITYLQTDNLLNRQLDRLI